MSRSTAQSPTPEATVWQGSPSQWTNFWPFVSCLLVIPIPWVIYRWLTVKTTRYTLSNQRIQLESGVLSKEFDNLELYRVKDSTLTQSLLQRLVVVGTIT